MGRDSSDLWLETFEMVSKTGLVALDSDLKEKITMRNYCLGAIYKSSMDDNTPSFIITAWDCKTKLSVVCEKEPTKFHPPNTEKPNFPCISDKEKERKKRQDSASAVEPSRPNGSKTAAQTERYKTQSTTEIDGPSTIGIVLKLR